MNLSVAETELLEAFVYNCSNGHSTPIGPSYEATVHLLEKISKMLCGAKEKTMSELTKINKPTVPGVYYRRLRSQPQDTGGVVKLFLIDSVLHMSNGIGGYAIPWDGLGDADWYGPLPEPPIYIAPWMERAAVRVKQIGYTVQEVEIANIIAEEAMK